MKRIYITLQKQIEEFCLIFQKKNVKLCIVDNGDDDIDLNIIILLLI